MRQIECPVPQVGEVLVRVRAAALNPADWKLSAGLFQSSMIPLPFTPGFDVAGVVEEIGPNVTGFQRGQAVIGWTRRGSFAEYTVVPAGVLAVAPANASFEEAATIPTGASTAWQGLFDNGNLQAGQRVLNVDLTLLAEAPKIGPWRDAIRSNVAALLGLAPACVNIKATTTEHLGFIGRSEGLAAMATVLIDGR